MGYTHYWRRLPHLDRQEFSAATTDIREVMAVMGKMGVKLAGPRGTGPAEITPDRVAFNGSENCGHTKRDLGITWPAKDAGGIGTGTRGQWFAGALLTERTCDGDCSHESFIIERDYSPNKWQSLDKGKYFSFCKTAYKPYDLAVTAVLIILKHHLGDAVVITSDGDDKDWRDAAMVCQMVVGYGADFKLEVKKDA